MVGAFRCIAFLALIVAAASLTLTASDYRNAAAQDVGTPVSEEPIVESPPGPTEPVPPTSVPDTPTEPETTDGASTEYPDSNVEDSAADDSQTDDSSSEANTQSAEFDQTSEATPETKPGPSELYFMTDGPNPECLPDPSGPEAVASGGFLEYECVERLSVEGANLVESDLRIEWRSRLRISGSWSIQVLPPASVSDPEPQWTAEGGQDVEFGWTGQASLVGESASQRSEVELRFRVRVHRPACHVTPPEVTLERVLTVASGNISGEDRSTEPDPTFLSPPLADIPAPSVRFQGPLTFGELSLDSTGLAGETRTGELRLSIEGLASSCGSWSLHMMASDLANADGSLLGGRLVVIGVNGEPLPDGGCDLAEGCELLSVLAGPERETLELNLDIELQAPVFPQTGLFRTTISADVAPAEA